MTPAIIAIGGVFAVSVAHSPNGWPAPGRRTRRSARPIGWRTAVFAVVSGLVGAGVAARSELPWWATGVYLVLLALLLVLTATDLEQRRLRI